MKKFQTDFDLNRQNDFCLDKNYKRACPNSDIKTL